VCCALSTESTKSNMFGVSAQLCLQYKVHMEQYLESIHGALNA
jgi:hypothetical protein